MPNLIQTENALAGSTGWMLTKGASGRQIEGFWSALSVNLGGSISLRVQSGGYHTFGVALSDYDVEIWRMGYYGGTGGRRVQGPIRVTGIAQPRPLWYTPSYFAQDSTSQTIYGCPDASNWTVGLTLDIPTTWVSGKYFAVLTRVADQYQSYAPFIVRDDARTSAEILVFEPDFTDYAYNTWGGRSSYLRLTSTNYPSLSWDTFYGDIPYPTNPASNATRASFNTPLGLDYVTNGPAGVDWAAANALTVGSGKFFIQPHTTKKGARHELVMAMERDGWDVRYASQLDRATSQALVNAPKIAMGYGHDEYWTEEERQYSINRRDRTDGLPGHLIQLSSNTEYWRVRLEADAQGTANRCLANHKDNNPDPQTPPSKMFTAAGESAETLLGCSYQSGAGARALWAANVDHWLWAGTGVTEGQQVGGSTVRGHEWDFSMQKVDPSGAVSGLAVPTPPPGTVTVIFDDPANAAPGSSQDLFTSVIVECPNGSKVFYASNTWYANLLASSPRSVPAWRSNSENAAVKTLTNNLFTAMGATPGAGAATITYEAEVSFDGGATWASIYSGQSDLEELVDISTWPAGTAQVRHRARNTATNEVVGWSVTSYPVQTGNVIQPPLLASAAQLFAPTVAPAPHPVLLPLLAGGAVLFAPSALAAISPTRLFLTLSYAVRTPVLSVSGRTPSLSVLGQTNPD